MNTIFYTLYSYSFAMAIHKWIRQLSKSSTLALILLFPASIHADIDVGLAIQNGLDSNGNITVPNGGKVKVAYIVIEDTDKELDKKDLIQLLRVSDDSIVDQVKRGKGKFGIVSLKVNDSEDEQLYVRYVRKGKAGIQVARTSHPDEPDIPLFSIAKMNILGLTVGLNAMNLATPGSGFVESNQTTGLSSVANIASITVTAPASGFVWVTYSAIATINHVNGLQSFVRFELSPLSTPFISGGTSFRHVGVPGTAASGNSYYFTVSTSQVYPVEAGDVTIYLHADSSGGGSNNLSRNNMHAIFIPNQI